MSSLDVVRINFGLISDCSKLKTNFSPSARNKLCFILNFLNFKELKNLILFFESIKSTFIKCQYTN